MDCVLRDGVPWPVEINPRYIASVEVLEYATGLRALARHRQVFDPAAEKQAIDQGTDAPRSLGFVGKAILFARQPLIFPGDGPWMNTLRKLGSIEEMPAFADIPHAGERIAAGRPVLTCFARGTSVQACSERLQQIASDTEGWLFGG